MFKIFHAIVLMFGLLSLLPASAAELSQVESTTAKFGDSYRIGVDDRIQVNVWKNTELSLGMPVRPDGKISLPLIGDVMAGGRTPGEVAAEIKERLSSYIRDPNVTIILTELHSHEYILSSHVLFSRSLFITGV